MTIIIVLFYVLGYLEDNWEVPFKIGKMCYNMSWSYLYVAYNCVLYQWVFSVHRVNLYGGDISVHVFR